MGFYEMCKSPPKNLRLPPMSGHNVTGLMCPAKNTWKSLRSHYMAKLNTKKFSI
jgi:hypothetical protein